jgi:hypothetical protein
MNGGLVLKMSLGGMITILYLCDGVLMSGLLVLVRFAVRPGLGSAAAKEALLQNRER